MDELQKITIKKEDGTLVEAKVVTFLKDNVLDKEYVLYTLDENEENVSIFASVFKETETSYELLPIESKEEWEMIQQEIQRLSKDN